MKKEKRGPHHVHRNLSIHVPSRLVIFCMRIRSVHCQPVYSNNNSLD